MRPVEFQNAREAEAYLLGLINYEMKTKYRRDTNTHDLEQFEKRLQAMDWVPGAVPTIHVGGTNGKGSVSMLVEALLRGGGKRTGLYTSPHLRDIRERIRLGGQPINEASFRRIIADLANRADPQARGIRTTFETLTAAAFLAFQEEAVDWAVIEVGLGGRLDATNVLPPGKAILTPISLDHQNVLGNTIPAIAADKAHILKAGGEAWIMDQPSEALKVIHSRLREESLEGEQTDASVLIDPIRCSETGTVFRITGREHYGEIQTRLLGSHQRENLQAAIAVCESILTPQEMKAALRSLESIVLPARLEVIRRWGKTFVIDGGHNPGAALAIRRAIETHFPHRKATAIIGLAKDKDVRGFLDILSPVLRRVVGTASGIPRAARGGTIAAQVPLEIPSCASTTVEEALRHVAEESDDLILVTGSFIVAGEVLEWLS